MPTPRGLRADVLLMLSAKFGVLILGAATTVIVARSLGPAGRGSLASTYALMMLLAQLGTFGIASANPYFAAREPHMVGRSRQPAVAGRGLGVSMAAVGIVQARRAGGRSATSPGPSSLVGMCGGADRAVLAVPAEHPAGGRANRDLQRGRVGAALLTVILLLTVLPLARQRGAARALVDDRRRRYWR